jgi:mercuric ion binding protein
MKKQILKFTIIGALALGGFNAQASIQDAFVEVESNHGVISTDTFMVYGNCGMCERTIEGALKDVKGVSKSNWSQKTKMMTVSYDKHVITLEEIQQKIAAVGYDTDAIRASKKSYKSLPGCCQYERPKGK